MDHLATVQVLCDVFLRADVSFDNALDLSEFSRAMRAIDPSVTDRTLHK